MHGAVELYRELEGRCVLLQILDDLVSLGIAVRIAGKLQSGKAVVAARREEQERVPASAPRSADRIGGLEDREVAASSRQEVPQSESRLARTYDGDLESIVRAVFRLVRHVESSLPATLPTSADCLVSDTICPERLLSNVLASVLLGTCALCY